MTTDGKGVLSGIRVIDLTIGVAGPSATQLMGFMGAEVIRISSEVQRGGRRNDADAGANNLFLNKLSLQLNLATPQGIDIVKRLVAVSDVLVENQRPGAIAKLGLDYESLRTIKPDIIAISLGTSGYGGTEQYVGYAPNFVSLSGVGHVSGYAGGPPGEYTGWPDYISGCWSTFGLMYALHHRQRTGEGQFIDVSAQESLGTLVEDSYMDVAMTGRVPTRVGNRDAAMAPHNVYRCRGDNEWISLAVATDEEWHSLCQVMALPALETDERFATALQRWHQQAVLDAIVSDWTCQRTSDELTVLLQGAGVAAMPVFSSERLYRDPHLKAQGRWTTVTHPKAAPADLMSPPWLFSETPATIRPWASNGEHEDYVLRTLLGMPEAEVQALRDRGNVLS